MATTKINNGLHAGPSQAVRHGGGRRTKICRERGKRKRREERKKKEEKEKRERERERAEKRGKKGRGEKDVLGLWV